MSALNHQGGDHTEPGGIPFPWFGADPIDEHELQRHPRNRQHSHLTGRHDMVVHVAVRDMKHLKDLALDSFTNRPGVTQIETSIIYEATYRHDLVIEET